jgi:hypothetical protein
MEYYRVITNFELNTYEEGDERLTPGMISLYVSIITGRGKPLFRTSVLKHLKSLISVNLMR